MGKLGCSGVVWMTLSMLAAFAASCGFFLPYWLQGAYRDSTPVYLSAFRRCNYPRMGADGQVELVMECGRYTDFKDIPSVWWQISTIAVGTGAALALLVASAGVSSLCIRNVLTRATSRAAALLQFFAGLLLSGGMAIYPLGLGNREVRRVCGDQSAPFQLGKCELCWAFHLTATAGGLTLLCSLIALCSPPKKAERS